MCFLLEKKSSQGKERTARRTNMQFSTDDFFVNKQYERQHRQHFHGLFKLTNNWQQCWRYHVNYLPQKVMRHTVSHVSSSRHIMWNTVQKVFIAALMDVNNMNTNCSKCLTGQWRRATAGLSPCRSISGANHLVSTVQP